MVTFGYNPNPPCQYAEYNEADELTFECPKDATITYTRVAGSIVLRTFGCDDHDMGGEGSTSEGMRFVDGVHARTQYEAWMADKREVEARLSRNRA